MRRVDVDWLRTFATWMLFPFHVAKIFDVPPFYHLKNAERVPELDLFTGFTHQWHMRLFFVLAGWSLCHSLATRGAAAVRRERFRRLLVPFLAGSLLFGPFLRWAELVNGLPATNDGTVHPLAGTGASFLTFLPTFFDPNVFTWGHLWFLVYLYAFTLLYLPLFERLLRRRPGGARAVARGAAYAPLLPLVLVEVTMRGRWPGMQNLYDDWANFCLYSLFFIVGFELGRRPAFEEAVHRESGRLGLLGLAAVTPMAFGLPAWANHVLGAVAAWGLVSWLLGFGARRLRFTNRALGPLRDSAYPIYILHSPAIVACGLVVLPLHVGIATKFTLILTGAVAMTVVAYAGMRRVAFLRPLFGMRPPGRHAVDAPARPASASA